jgi:hypothetical protein
MKSPFLALLSEARCGGGARPGRAGGGARCGGFFCGSGAPPPPPFPKLNSKTSR